MVRVTRPGGVRVVGGAGQSGYGQPAVRRWLAPVLRLAKRYGIPPASRVGASEGLGDTLREAGLVDIQERLGQSPVVLRNPKLTVRALAQAGASCRRRWSACRGPRATT